MNYDQTNPEQSMLSPEPTEKKPHKQKTVIIIITIVVLIAIASTVILTLPSTKISRLTLDERYVYYSLLEVSENFDDISDMRIEAIHLASGDFQIPESKSYTMSRKGVGQIEIQIQAYVAIFYYHVKTTGVGEIALFRIDEDGNLDQITETITLAATNVTLDNPSYKRGLFEAFNGDDISDDTIAKVMKLLP
ncbi:hypothetical protein LJC60_04375 [Ruminococcaceae bacterium OttesenSCG-928-D13]|nr:hypothetical protein [Ruminococcaceae bacterium OttesenSCG-928-D13]